MHSRLVFIALFILQKLQKDNESGKGEKNEDPPVTTSSVAGGEDKKADESFELKISSFPPLSVSLIISKHLV